MKYIFTIVVFLCSIIVKSQLYESDTTLLLMGTQFELQAVSKLQLNADSAVREGVKEIERIEQLISSHQPESQTTLINNNAGIKPVHVDEELFFLIQRCLKISELSDGAFDISFGPLYDVWHFNGIMEALPPDSIIQKAVSKVNWKNVVCNTTDKTIFLKKKGMRIGFGAIGKGYAANMAQKKMKQFKLQGGFVNASGDILFWGHNSEKSLWKVAIASPINKTNVIGWLEVSNMAVVTSGNYEKNLKIGSTVYSHIVDPKTGYPTQESVSVTVVTPNAEIADGLATALSVLGRDNGIRLVNQLKNVECLMIFNDGTFVQSNGLKLIPASKN